MRVLLVVIAAVAALTLAGSAAADQSYSDPCCDASGGGDVTGVSVATNQSAGTVTFTVQTNLGGLDANTFLAVLLDSDQNPATGTAGFDYVVTGNRYGGTLVNTVTPHVVTAQSSFANGVWTVTVGLDAIGNPKAFDFFVLTQTGPDPRFPEQDRAPDTGVWTYDVVPPPPPPPPPAPTVASVAPTWHGSPVHGKVFRVTGLAVGLSDGTKASVSSVTCAATLAGRRLGGAGAGGCSFALPKSAKGRRLVVTVRGAYGAAHLARTSAFRVR